MKHQFLSRYLYIFYSTVFLLHIMNIFIDNEGINYFIGLLAFIMLVVSFSKASRLFKILGLSFLIVGGVLFFYTEKTISEIPNSLTSNMALLTLLCMLPWMSSVVWSGRFDKSLNTMMKYNVTDLGKLYLRSSATTLSLAAFLNLSAISISQDVLKENLDKMDTALRNSFMSMSTLRSFSLAVLWSPLEILLAVTIFVTGVNYVSLLPWLLVIATLTFILDNLWGRFYFKKHPYEIDNRMKFNKQVLIKRFAQLTVALGMFLLLVILCGSILKINFILSVTLIIFPFSFIWSLVLKRMRSFLILGWNTWKQKTNTMQNFIVLFISLSFFSNSLSNTTFLDVIQKPFHYVADYPLLIFFVIQLLFITMSMFGIHPIAIIGILTGLITTLIEVFNPLSLAIVIVTSAMATLTVSTYGLIVTLTAMNTKQSPYKITWMNMPYALMFGGIGSIVAYFLL
ncbi:hypothetical protein ACFFF5_18790 [Lederbergia wuyishanensis]|uniref:Uncharacterized protein n=1 Tax=Lederbergia wuyishanensis TaxID=1347903 RepID=A0ABU0D8Z1_9BACI|nr:hypothetical protein [Lederbergia wuyishanensis]MCJ8009493.1 hypothetical protein [Lederbergia wuyishanensis]MDQ0344897.1 hypothetical protein [Lederbergia wuyishanensis]